MHATIAHKIHTILQISHFRGWYNPSTRKRVTKEAMCVYTYATFLASVATCDILGVPFKSRSYRGFVYFPKDYVMTPVLFFWLVFSPAYMLILLGYITWSAIDIL